MNGDFLSRPQPAGDRFAERRSVPRYELVAEIEVFEPIQRTTLKACITQLGANGCYVRTVNPLPQTTVIQLRIIRDQGAFHAWGRVAYARDGAGMGIVFFRAEPPDEQILGVWLAELKAKEATPESDELPAEKERTKR